eukprot:TRINITY_DN3358_c0_g1_i3.p3 TRINITY_DN3358_c0_g1~~TRINITY_DN3358_c0_g1_i3.p3  ORF type:complete len:118 (+),score=2.44 TRINITY_DN3358_c0_g1_i3:661-1014(+)
MVKRNQQKQKIKLDIIKFVIQQTSESFAINLVKLLPHNDFQSSSQFDCENCDKQFNNNKMCKLGGINRGKYNLIIYNQSDDPDDNQDRLQTNRQSIGPKIKFPNLAKSDGNSTTLRT